MIANPKGSATQVSKYFKSYEFDCPCSNCSQTFIDEDLLLRLDDIREESGFPLKITSGYRCDHHQAQLKEQGFETAKGRSQHQDGKAADILNGHHTGRELEVFARKAGFKAVGVGNRFVHVDTRSDRDRSWTYSY